MQFQAGCNGKIYSEEQLLAKETLPWLLILLFFFLCRISVDGRLSVSNCFCKFFRLYVK